VGCTRLKRRNELGLVVGGLCESKKSIGRLVRGITRSKKEKKVGTPEGEKKVKN